MEPFTPAIGSIWVENQFGGPIWIDLSQFESRLHCMLDQTGLIKKASVTVSLSQTLGCPTFRRRPKLRGETSTGRGRGGKLD